MIKFWSYEREYNKIKNNLLKDLNKTIKSGNIFFGKQRIIVGKQRINLYNNFLAHGAFYAPCAILRLGNIIYYGGEWSISALMGLDAGQKSEIFDFRVQALDMWKSIYR